MKTKLVVLATVLFSSASSFASAKFTFSQCEVKAKADGKVTKLQTLEDYSNGIVDGLDFEVLFNDPTGKSAQVGIADKNSPASSIFHAVTTIAGTFDYAVFFTSSSGANYVLNCKALN